jgi:hypothetical protein
VNETDITQRVELANELDGPLWPPRRRGVPEAGWTDDGFAGTFEPGAHALGYASPAPPVDPPLTVVSREPVDHVPENDFDTPADVVRHCGDPSPPRDAVPVPETDSMGGASTAASRQSDDGVVTPDHEAGDTGGCKPVRSFGRPGRQTSSRSYSRQYDKSAGESETASTETAVEPTTGVDGGPPEEVQRWLTECERRLDRAETVADATSVPAATEAVAAAGGLHAVQELVATVDDDAAALAAVERRVADLRERADAVDVPLDSLERLA